ncbi:cysteine hydrolase [Mesorhizobium sp. CA18]|uniref:cysteine hydrolase family protein n=1 Tax=unclassified Mesorhizobium TaxID=325217 RepID=UPI001CCADEBE|nr:MULTISPECIES: isochorismatase family cysteine hydrolase [unclassified Mesorhizobium]MBZ9733484.1 cysteine hydrolase [Mesorhizobium sp. CA9]MBZ9824149.1 cysteine hydrolase [Mesorhizobium sp. CA18]MBZ9831365.1 cysteine hydrolase [Mesorhizobium sp. CA2]MBZ9837529.1 cysteine hydrolase [Mesorhizobium sp. CA3]MBZ9877187.1 cysteine hydrolase [Mesorhizobium sp. Ca11]
MTPISTRAVHICVDMQMMFLPPGPWAVEWLPAILPKVLSLVDGRPERTIFTRFITARRPGEGQGHWRQYYERWSQMTIECAGPGSLELLPELRDFVPPARVFDKSVYSPWLTGELHRSLQAEGVTELIVSGGEADMCVLATLLGAIDFGYRTILVEDAICSTSDEAYENMLKLFTTRYSHHVEVAAAEEVLDFWR